MLLAILYFIVIIASLYSLFILYVAFSWGRIPIDKLRTQSNLITEVVVPMKNEESYIEECITSIRNNSSVAYTITVVDDGSTDQSSELAKSELRPIDKIITTHSGQRGKKYAIVVAIDESTAELILTTDGDSTVSSTWVEGMTGNLSDDVDLVLGPVFIKSPQSFISHFQQFDLIATMAVTGVGHYKKWFYSGSAACMAYRNKTYSRLKPYDNNFHIPSGDDIFFIEKILSTSGKIKFIKQPETYVLTSPVDHWGRLIDQRVRWASKSEHYKHKGLKRLWTAVGLSLLCFCLGLAIVPIGIFGYSVLGIWILKSIVDFNLIFKVAKFYKLPVNFYYFLPSLLLYPFFILLVGMLSKIRPLRNW